MKTVLRIDSYFRECILHDPSLCLEAVSYSSIHPTLFCVAEDVQNGLWASLYSTIYFLKPVDPYTILGSNKEPVQIFPWALLLIMKIRKASYRYISYRVIGLICWDVSVWEKLDEIVVNQLCLQEVRFITN